MGFKAGFSWILSNIHVVFTGPAHGASENYSSYFEMNLLNFEVTDRNFKIPFLKRIFQLFHRKTKIRTSEFFRQIKGSSAF